MIGNMVSSFRTKLCLMGCLNAHIIIFISRDRFMDIRRQGIYRCMSYRSFDTGRLWGNIICLCLAKTKFCSSASGNISFLPQLAVFLWSDFIHCLFCLRCGFFRFSSSLFTASLDKSSSVKRSRVGLFAIYYPSFSLDTSDNLVVIIRYSSMSFGNRSTNGRITLP